MSQLLRTKPSVDARISAALIAGFPLTTRRALRRAGVSNEAIAYRIADGHFHEPWSGTIFVGVSPALASSDLIARAAVATVEPHAALDGPSALHGQGVWLRHDGRVHVTSQHMRRSLPDFDIEFHRTCALGLRSRDVRRIPMRIAIEAMFTAAPHLTEHQLTNVLRNCLYERLFTIEEFEQEAARRGGMRAIRRIRRALDLYRGGSAGTKSNSEDKLVPYASVAFGEPLVNVFGSAGIVDYEPDMCWPEQRFIIEVDGDQHMDDPIQRAKDLSRDGTLRAAGWVVMRVPWREVWQSPGDVIDRARAELARR